MEFVFGIFVGLVLGIIITDGYIFKKISRNFRHAFGRGDKAKGETEDVSRKIKLE